MESNLCCKHTVVDVPLHFSTELLNASAYGHINSEVRNRLAPTATDKLI